MSIRGYVKAFISERFRVYPNHLHVIDRAAGRTVQMNNMVDLKLDQIRWGARTNKLDLEDFSSSNKLSDYLILGEANQEISVPELMKTVRDNLSRGLIGGFVQVMHPTAAPSNPASSTPDSKAYNAQDPNPGKKGTNMVGPLGNRILFVREIQRLVTALSAPEFTREAISIVTTALKDFVIRDGQAIEEKGTAELFFIHIFDIICERSGIDDLNQSLNRLIRRENRPYIHYNDLVLHAYKLHLARVRGSSAYVPAVKATGLFSEDAYPLALHLYSQQMLEAYIEELIDRLSNDLFRILAVNLLNPIITNTIEVSLKTVKHKDFSKQEKLINDSIKTLERQLETIETLSKVDAATR